MEIITTNKQGELATRALNLQAAISAPTSFKNAPAKNAQNLNVWDYTKQFIRIEYKSLVFAAKRAIKDETQLNSNIEKVCSWMQDVKRKPWLRIAGYIGNGKTTMLRAVKNWYDKNHQRQMITFFSANDFVKLAVSDPERFNQVIMNHPRLMIDDLGTEPNEVQVYGNKMQPMREMFYARYDKKLVTIFSTNLRDEDFSAYYGERIADRCREMQQKIIFTQESYR